MRINTKEKQCNVSGTYDFIIKNCTASQKEQRSINFHLLDTHANTVLSPVSALTDLAWICKSETAFPADLYPDGRKLRGFQSSTFALP